MSSSDSDRYARLNRFCDENPVVRSQFEEIMDLVENAGDGFQTADEVEERIIELSRRWNAQMLSGWCQGQERQVSATQEADSELRGAGKKNCSGSPRLG